ncbi:MAG: phosphodiesterase [Clostridia bacterium]|nr:phosphodiesterase [Clostridia bacterium]
MKILIASDIHGSACYCRLLLDRIAAEQPDRIFLLGDILYHGPRNDLPREYNPKQVIAMLNPLARRITAVRGNCDAEVDQMVLDFDVMQTYREEQINGMPFILTHGHHYNPDKPFPLETRHVLLNGHFHVPELTDKGAYVYVNCGSVSIPKQNSPHSYVIYEDNHFWLKDVETGEVFDSLEQSDLAEPSYIG